jgi:predicted kinase
MFGARGVGKSTFIQEFKDKKALVFDLLDPEVEDRFLLKTDTARPGTSST